MNQFSGLLGVSQETVLISRRYFLGWVWSPAPSVAAQPVSIHGPCVVRWVISEYTRVGRKKQHTHPIGQLPAPCIPSRFPFSYGYPEHCLIVETITQVNLLSCGGQKSAAFREKKRETQGIIFPTLIANPGQIWPLSVEGIYFIWV